VSRRLPEWWYTVALAAVGLTAAMQAFPFGIAVLLTAGALVGGVALRRIVERTPSMQTRRFAVLLLAILAVLLIACALAAFMVGSGSGQSGDNSPPVKVTTTR
jgi:predicted PurR-regulated permease PerM